MKKWINVELPSESANELRTFLKSHDIYYEASECFNLIHFEIKATDAETPMVERFLDWKYYIRYLRDWAEKHTWDGYYSMSPFRFDEFIGTEYGKDDGR